MTETDEVASDCEALSPSVANDNDIPATTRAPMNADHAESYSPFVAYCTTVNYILGVGVIGMPKAFVTGGWLLSAIVMLVVSVMATFTALYYVEIGHRAQRKLKIEQELDSETNTGGALELSSVDSRNNGAIHGHGTSVSDSDVGAIIVTHDKSRRIEVNELIGIYIGQTTRKLYEVLLCVYMIGSLWSYTSVFSTAMAAHVPMPFINDGDTCIVSGASRTSGCYGLYIFYNAVFACIVVPLACRNLTEMKVFVVCLALLRFVAIGAMILTAVDMIEEKPATDDSGAEQSLSSSPPYWSTAPAFNWSGLGTIFPICIFAQIFHHSVPGIAYPLKDKRAVPLVFTSCLFTMFTLYSSLGIVLALYFGYAIKGQCTLNWSHYPNWFWSYLIVLFPAADVLSAFPLKAITVGNNIVHSFLSLEERNVRRKVIPYRLFAAVTPIVGACIFNDLTQLLTYTGSLGIVVAFLFPTWLQYRSQQDPHSRGRSGVLKDNWDTVVNSRLSMLAVAGFSVAGLIAVLVSIIQGAGH